MRLPDGAFVVQDAGDSPVAASRSSAEIGFSQGDSGLDVSLACAGPLSRVGAALAMRLALSGGSPGWAGTGRLVAYDVAGAVAVALGRVGRDVRLARAVRCLAALTTGVFGVLAWLGRISLGETARAA